MPTDWTRVEVEAIAGDYFAMLAKELQRVPYNKTAHRNTLTVQLQGRSAGSIERKHQNISAILIGIGYPYISGYKPLGNYQRLLREIVVDRVVSDQQLAKIVSSAVSEPAKPPTIEDILASIEEAPEGKPFTYTGVSEVLSLNHPTLLPPVNYLEREARNSSLGRAGEEFVVRFERARLIQLGANTLAERVEHVSVTQGDGQGFDVRSFEGTGEDRFIEVKTTAYGKETPFFVSRNEVAVSKITAQHYHVLRVFEFRKKPRIYSLKGSLADVCWLEPVQYAARPR